jgi:hypothetical protein
MLTSPDALTRIVSDFLPLAASARLVCTSTAMRTLLQPVLDDRAKRALEATAGVPDSLAESLFAVFRPLFRNSTVFTEISSDGKVLSQSLLRSTSRSPGNIALHAIVSVTTDPEHPRIVVVLNHAAAAWSPLLGYSNGSPVPDSAWHLEHDPFFAAFVMDSADAGCFAVRGAGRGEYARGIAQFLRSRGRLPSEA